jgi:UDP:flavonoid glycosyltransferase YjiC (YdhE family)
LSRILFVWEMGEGYGHVALFPELALRLRERGHEVGFVLKELPRGERVLAPHGFPMLQAPVWPRRPRQTTLAASYAEILTRVGWLEPEVLAASLRAWRSLFALWRPDTVLLNHSPTALLASTGMGFRRVLLGTGFECPLCVLSRPRFPPWGPVPLEQMGRIEDRLLAAVDAALGRLGLAPLEDLARLAEAEDTLLCTIRELDPYRRLRGESAYYGPLAGKTSGVPPELPEGPGRRVFAYLKTAFPNLQPLLAALARADASVLAYVAGLSAADAAKIRAPGLRISTEPVDLAGVLARCDALVCHGGHGTVSDALLAGVPVLVAPIHLENWINASSAVKAGVGLMSKPQGPRPDFDALVRELLGSAALHAKAAELAEKYRGLVGKGQIRRMVERLDVV